MLTQWMVPFTLRQGPAPGLLGTLSVLFDANKTFEDIKVGVGYKNTFGDLNLFADAAIFYVKDQTSVNKDGETVKDELGNP